LFIHRKKASEMNFFLNNSPETHERDNSSNPFTVPGRLSRYTNSYSANQLGAVVLATLLLASCGGGTMSSIPKPSAASPSSGSGGSSGSGSPGGGSPSHTSPITGPDRFTFSGYTWETHTGNAPPVGNANGNVGTLSASQVTVGNELVLALTQTQQGDQVLSEGAEVQTTDAFSYGTFEFTSQVPQAISGTTASGFLFTNNSQTEIDMEQTGNKPDAVDCTNWSGLSNYQDTEVTGFDQTVSHKFKIVWQPDKVDWYVDGQLVVSHADAVPSAPAPFLFNLWGTNKSNWGGVATAGVTRYMHISNFSYTP
jgi:beta-glucanase (GH16 family)